MKKEKKCLYHTEIKKLLRVYKKSIMFRKNQEEPLLFNLKILIILFF